MTAVYVPRVNVASTPASAVTGWRAVPYVLVRPSTRTASDRSAAGRRTDGALWMVMALPSGVFAAQGVCKKPMAAAVRQL
jgi:hypothetical protein